MDGAKFLDLSTEITRRIGSRSNSSLRGFQSFFGISPRTCAIIWNQLNLYSLAKSSKPIHLLWSLQFLRLYETETVNATLAGVDEKTYRKWSWFLIEALSCLSLINWNERLFDEPYIKRFATIDGTDCPIEEPKNFDPKWYSHKINSAGLRDEICVSLRSKKILWTHGPFPCGSWPDLKIFKSALEARLREGETIVADSGYKDASCMTPDDLNSLRSKLHGRLRARHETLNGRLRTFSVLSKPFRHELRKHGLCFNAIVNIVQLSLEEDPSFTIPGFDY